MKNSLFSFIVFPDRERSAGLYIPYSGPDVASEFIHSRPGNILYNIKYAIYSHVWFEERDQMNNSTPTDLLNFVLLDNIRPKNVKIHYLATPTKERCR